MRNIVVVARDKSTNVLGMCWVYASSPKVF
jgi:hypothetical protein